MYKTPIVVAGFCNRVKTGRNAASVFQRLFQQQVISEHPYQLLYKLRFGLVVIQSSHECKCILE